jgi:flagellin-like protein
MQKRGVSEIVATVLIIVIVVAAVGILWTVVSPMIKNNLNQISCSDIKLTINLDKELTCSDISKNRTIIMVKRGSDNFNITALKVFLIENGTSHNAQIKSPEPSQILTATISDTKFVVDEVKITPIINYNGKQKTCDIVVSSEVPACVIEDSFKPNEVKLLDQQGNGEGSVNECDDDNDCQVGKMCRQSVCVPKEDGGAQYPLIINNCTELQNIQNNLSAYYILGNSFSCVGVNFQPIGIFAGNLDGKGFSVSDLNIYKPDMEQIGLFTQISGNISNLGLINLNITGGRNVGGIVGWQTSGSSIVNSYTTGKIEGTGNNPVTIGGLVGISIGNIYNSYSSSEVTGAWKLGGLVGNFGGVINNSYATGNIYSWGFPRQEVGGLVGAQFDGLINNSYSAGVLQSSGVARIGGLLGYNTGGLVQNSFWDNEVSGKSTSAGGPGVVGKNTSQMQTPSTFTNVGWDNQTVWNIQNNQYPRLKWQN